MTYEQIWTERLVGCLSLQDELKCETELSSIIAFGIPTANSLNSDIYSHMITSS